MMAAVCAMSPYPSANKVTIREVQCFSGYTSIIPLEYMLWVNIWKYHFYTADFMKNVPGVYTHSMETIYVSIPNAQVARGTFFRKSGIKQTFNYTA